MHMELNNENEILNIGGKIDSLVEALSLADQIPEGESVANLIDIDIDQALA